MTKTKILFLFSFLCFGLTFTWANEHTKEYSNIMNIESLLEEKKEQPLEQLIVVSSQNVQISIIPGCKVTVTIVWEDGSDVTATFESSNCSAAMGAARKWLDMQMQ